MELGLIKKVDIDSEMQQSYLDYAMSVIVSRALPDARDGLKPVQRRILYAMYDMGLRAGTSYKKSARIVGEVLGKYHPHGDMAVYEAMARMAQDFSMRTMLVDGQGNFGSVDGDPPAAMRYTEARLAPPAIEMLSQIDKNTVNFLANFDDTLEEPEVLPAAIPNLLVNGATGIAVGMATNIPPHNLGEVVDALVYMLQQWEHLDDLSVDTLMKFIQGPDFPTGGIIIQDPLAEGLTSAYGSGRGRVIVQARAHMEEMVRGRNRIIVTELPYTVNKASLIERIAELVREGGLEGVSDLRDESDRQGMRIVIELSKTAEPEKVLRELYQRTQMKSTFGINMLALVDGEPRLLSLKQALRVYLEHRLVVIKRRAEFELEKAKARAHILEGLRIALQNLDEIISLIRSSPDADQARIRLIKKFRLSEIQAQAILDMPLRRLAALERKKIEDEYKEVTALIKDLEGLLRSPKKMRQTVSEELTTVKTAFADRRRTQIATLKEGDSITNLLTTTDLTPALSVYVSITEDGRISRTLDDAPPHAVEGQRPYWLVRASTHDTLYLTATNGKAAAIPVHALPAVDDFTQGIQLPKACALTDNDPLACVFSLPPRNGEPLEGYLMTVSRAGLVKKSAVSDLPGPSAQTFLLCRVNEGDALGWVIQTSGEEEVILATRKGMAIRFSEDDVRPMGLVAAGVGGIKLSTDDELVGAFSLSKASELIMVLKDGKAKRVPLKEFPVQSRYGQGVIAWKLAKDMHVAGVIPLHQASHILVSLSHTGTWDLPAHSVPAATRAGQGKLAVKAATGEEVIAVLDLPLAGLVEEKLSKPADKPVKMAKTESEDGHINKPSETQQHKPAAAAKTKSGSTKSAAKMASPTKSDKTKQGPAIGEQELLPGFRNGASKATSKVKTSTAEKKAARPAKTAPGKPTAKAAATKSKAVTKTAKATLRKTAAKPAGKTTTKKSASVPAAKVAAKPAAKTTPNQKGAAKSAANKVVEGKSLASGKAPATPTAKAVPAGQKAATKGSTAGIVKTGRAATTTKSTELKQGKAKAGAKKSTQKASPKPASAVKTKKSSAKPSQKK